VKISGNDLDSIFYKSVRPGSAKTMSPAKADAYYSRVQGMLSKIKLPKLDEEKKKKFEQISSKPKASMSGMRSPEAATSSSRRGIAKGASGDVQKAYAPAVEKPSPAQQRAISARATTRVYKRGGELDSKGGFKHTKPSGSGYQKLKDNPFASQGEAAQYLSRGTARRKTFASDLGKLFGKKAEDLKDDYRVGAKGVKRTGQSIGRTADEFAEGFKSTDRAPAKPAKKMKKMKKSFEYLNEYSLELYKSQDFYKAMNKVREYAAMVGSNKMNLKDALDKLPNDLRDDFFSELRKVKGKK